jgi:hypothetical protein
MTWLMVLLLVGAVFWLSIEMVDRVMKNTVVDGLDKE